MFKKTNNIIIFTNSKAYYNLTLKLFFILSYISDNDIIADFYTIISQYFYK
ncbi:hypothetical protein A1OE_784 [Candidatus Endolissoclinum faulkneri L2]|uniref:Uncharacterized protein n=1 Tax=Candidatus Endolissoclinum faulkneri L2 TaxID=1193729 RepID=K7YR27_9PROT|nr:hypothetical protein A1OE_784 [Candidatus Endolissoclinum faulkneri L2]